MLVSVTTPVLLMLLLLLLLLLFPPLPLFLGGFPLELFILELFHIFETLVSTLDAQESHAGAGNISPCPLFEFMSRLVFSQITSDNGLGSILVLFDRRGNGVNSVDGGNGGKSCGYQLSPLQAFEPTLGSPFGGRQR